MDVKTSCPLGHTCETSDGKVIIRCEWYQRIVGLHPQTGHEVDQWKCALAWLPILLVENAGTNRGQTAALESFRNEMVQGQKNTTRVLALAAGMQTKGDPNAGNKVLEEREAGSEVG